ncbi:MAG: ubiquinol-cytochrome c reductase iron-sulfur subunit [Roseitalea sp.]|jgi:ubiquinol-cytochrome c reductase iron-sulfur subunit|uniref:Ubiquinol-cytochrome c reductase iron-sulfur subunit n=1 Tax=Oceaniradius stylonematis TaxID=2184161 RepID=A0A3A8ABL9_9HYPH|nr:ubiquinol-cytochrome c reductase iron-sulfur subunit [Oceaniradius stylonematis]MBO6552044.1 ubiquinol-cytochrome c reductase iron-sulfur subunit [Roseitalea sp.]MBO6951576.1 ubiquinol-cytochrome c reductase iron-sulfur subunit [Rhizobiaceae bacterium]MBO6592578.1 ubiquinol-cytochrome c reductase iron-sulfur subunit [Roseitalea sp.]MBO6598833.1 ubiquinol-cytochrome c reductase iron-sulfur subunit [Roseitalea sp.]MBO6611279.1 ubiquinol-cytochrome c reductase iron-sulfur subunit [Roseitalea s
MSDANSDDDWPPQIERRDFLFVSTGMMAAVGTAVAVWPFIDAMNPSADVQALATTEVDLEPIAAGQRITVIWRSQPVFIERRTPEQVAQAKADDDSPDLIDPATDASRVKSEEWLVVVGVCTHLGCVPLGQREGDERGEWGGWFCPCHGSHYDTSGRIRRGPAPRNLVVPPYELRDDGTVLIG